MQWIFNYQFFLFDFDGLLVDTEHLHYQAYINMCANRGFDLQWSFQRYSKAAHHKSTDLRDQIYNEFPLLYKQEPDWQVLYAEKKQQFLHLIETDKVPLLPGAAALLLALQQANINRCVVTHSASSLITQIRKQNPILDTIPLWITREDYTNPKPHPECYQLAIAKFAKSSDNIIGFEDSPRGLHALSETRAHPVLICPPDSNYLQSLLSTHKNMTYYPDFTSIHDNNHPAIKSTQNNGG